MLTYQAEKWTDVLPEMMGLWPEHWDELAAEKDKIPLDPDLERYASMAARGALHVVTARKMGELVGYYVWIVSAHLHYRSTLVGIADMYWLRPDCRKGFAGVRFIKESEKHIKMLGVKKLFSSTKCWLDVSSIFERLGWKQTERVYCKYIGT